MTADHLITYGPYILTGLQALVLAALYFLRNELVPRKDFALLVGRVDKAERDHAKLAQEVEDLPTSKELVQLSLQLKGIEGQQGAFTATLQGLNTHLSVMQAQLNTITQHLMRDGDLS